MSSRQSMVHVSTTDNTYHSSILVVKLYDPPNTVWALCVDGRIQYVVPYQSYHDKSPPHVSSIMDNGTFHSSLYEMMTHIPMCSVQMEPSYLLILNTRRTSSLRKLSTTTGTGYRNSNGMVGYGIVHQLLQYYTSSIYKIIFVEEDPVLYDIYIKYMDTKSIFRQEERITVLHTNPLSVNSTDVISSRYHVIFVIDDDIDVAENRSAHQICNESSTVDEDISSPKLLSRDRYRSNIYRALVPNGGVACFLTSPNNVLRSQSNSKNNFHSTIPMQFEYAAVPNHSSRSMWDGNVTNGSDVTLLQLCIRLTNRETTIHSNTTFRTKSNISTLSCRRPIRPPVSSAITKVAAPFPPLNWYSSETHVSAFTLPPMVQRQLFPFCGDTNNASEQLPTMEQATLLSDDATHPVPIPKTTLSKDTHAAVATDTRCHPQDQFGCIGENVHRFIQRYFPRVAAKFVPLSQQ